MQIRISSFESVRDNRVKHQTVPFGEFIEEFLGEPELAEDDEDKLSGAAWSPASYSGDVRSKHCLTTCSCLPFDFDKGSDGSAGLARSDVDSLFSWLNKTNYKFVSHSSYSSGFFYPREKLRVILFLTREVTPDEYVKLWDAIVRSMPVKPDVSRRTPTALYFTPRIPKGHRDKYQAYSEGDLLIDVDALLPKLGGLRLVRDPVRDLQAASEKEPALNRAAYALGLKQGQHGGKLDLDKVWAECKSALEQNTTSDPVKDWSLARQTADEAASDGFRAAGHVPVPEGWQPSDKQLKKAHNELVAECKLVKADPRSNLEGAAYRLGRFVPHVLAEKLVRDSLVMAAADSTAFLPVPEADPVIAMQVAAGRQRPRFIISQTGWRSKLTPLTDGEGYVVSEANAKVILCEHPEVSGVLRYNKRTGFEEVVKSPPWDNAHVSFPLQLDTPEAYDCALWLARRDVLGGSLGVVAVREAMFAAAKGDPYDPFYDYLKALKWDGVARLDSWLEDYAGAEPSRYTQLCAKNFLIGAVARTFTDDAQVDTVLVLVGNENKGKSRLLNALAGVGGFSDEFSRITKDSHLLMERFAIVEIAEIDKFMQYDEAEIKSFITTRRAHIRPSYARTARMVVRRAVLAASTNADEFLKSVTGNRRFLPVRVSDNKCDVSGIEGACSQLWAEAVHRYEAGESWWLDADTDIQEAVAKQEEARVKDEWEFELAFLDDRRPATAREYSSVSQLHTLPGMQVFPGQFDDEGRFLWVTIRQVAEHLRLDHGNLTVQKRVGKALRTRGWGHIQLVRCGNAGIQRTFRRSNVPQK